MAETGERNDRHSPAGLVRTIPPFVGRREQVSWFGRCIQEVIAGRPRVVLIPGEAGFGKTRLLQEVRAQAERHGLQVYLGRSSEAFALPYLPFVKVLALLWQQVPEEAQRTLGADAEIIERFLHHDRITLPPGNFSPSAQADHDKFQLFLAVARTLIKLAQRSPVLVAIDDLHWADQPSLDLFGELVFAIADAAVQESIPLLIVGAYRPVEPVARLAQLVARLQREAICHTLGLAGFDESEIYDLLQVLSLARPTHQLVATIREATQGNPLFIQEVVYHLRQQEALRERDGYLVTTSPAADLRLPEHVTGAILARTQGLSDGCQRALTLASFLGERFTLQSLEAVSDMGEDALLNLLEEGMHQGLLLSEGQGFQFAHTLIQRVFYNVPSVARRQRLHAQIAHTLERLYADDLDDHALEIAYHLVRAGPAAEGEKVARYARWAGDQVFGFFAWGEAAHYYTAALSAAQSTDCLSPQDRAELHYRAGFAYHRNQDVAPCLEHYEKAVEIYRLTGDISGLAQVLMEKTRIQFTLASVPYGTLVDVQPLEDILEALAKSEPRLRGSIAAVMAVAYWHAKQTDKAREMAQHALEIGQRIQDNPLCAYASFALGLAQAQRLHARETLQSWRHSLTYARRTDDLWLQGWPLQRMSPMLFYLGQLDEAEAVALEACEVTRTHDWGGYSVALSALACVAVAKGSFDEVERRTHEAMMMVDRSSYPWGGLRALYALACARALRGARTEAAKALDTLVQPGRVFKEVGPTTQAFVQTFRQLLRAHSEPYDDAMAQCAVDLARMGTSDSYSLAPLCALVEIGDLIAAPAMTEVSYEALSLAVERGVLFPNGWVFLIPRVLGVAATLNRWWDKAEAHFQMAIEVADRVGAWPELGRSYLDYARMLVARSGMNDPCHALDLLQQARPILDQLDMVPFIERAAQLAQTLQERKPTVPRRRSTYADDLSEQEVEVLLHIARDHIRFIG